MSACAPLPAAGRVCPAPPPVPGAVAPVPLLPPARKAMPVLPAAVLRRHTSDCPLPRRAVRVLPFVTMFLGP